MSLTDTAYGHSSTFLAYSVASATPSRSISGQVTSTIRITTPPSELTPLAATPPIAGTVNSPTTPTQPASAATASPQYVLSEVQRAKASSASHIPQQVIDDATFLTLQQDLEEQGLRYWYQRDKRILIVEIPSHIHEGAVEAIRLPLNTVIQKQIDRPSDWKTRTNLTMSCDDDAISRGIPDLVLTDKMGAPYLVVEVAFSQPQADVMKKAQSWMEHPDNVGVIVINITEQPSFANPAETCSNSDRMTPALWETRFEDAKADNQWGPIIVGGRKWLGKLSCSVQVLAKYSQGCEATDVLSPGADTTVLDQAIKDLWRALLRQRAQNAKHLADLCIDWAAFRKAIEDDMNGHAYDRFKMWARPAKRGAEELRSTARKKPQALID